MSYQKIFDNGHVVKLRKRRQCEWCNEWIEKGELAVVRVCINMMVLMIAASIRNVAAMQQSGVDDFSFGGQDRGRVNDSLCSGGILQSAEQWLKSMSVLFAGRKNPSRK